MAERCELLTLPLGMSVALDANEVYENARKDSKFRQLTSRQMSRRLRALAPIGPLICICCIQEQRNLIPMMTLHDAHITCDCAQDVTRLVASYSRFSLGERLRQDVRMCVSVGRLDEVLD